MSRSSGRRRGQVEPTAALVAVAALTVVFAAYAGAFDAAVPETSGDDAPAALTRVAADVTVGGVVRPEKLASTDGFDTSGERVNVTLRSDGRHWSAGPRRPSGSRRRAVDTAVKPVAVGLSTGAVRPGRLRVVVW